MRHGRKVLPPRDALLLAALAACVALNIHWGPMGTVMLAMPYAMIAEALGSGDDGGHRGGYA